MRKFIVVTTINPITPAIRAFDQLEDEGWELLVVADQKTPVDSYYDNLEYGTLLTCQQQERHYPKLSELLGWNTVDRRNLGFLYAYQKGADIVAMMDDDNIPKEGWGRDVVLNAPVDVDWYEPNAMAFDPLSVTNHRDMWHRGFPVELLECRNALDWDKRCTIMPLVRADLWDDDPDVDAMCRMQHRPSATFDVRRPFASDKPSPFNMQNTFVHRKALPYVVSIPETGRMCDIWGAYHFQAHFKDAVCYGPASVVHTQERSWESIVKDLEDEVLGYRHSLELLRRLKSDADAIFDFITPRAAQFMRLYREHFE